MKKYRLTDRGDSYKNNTKALCEKAWGCSFLKNPVGLAKWNWDTLIQYAVQNDQENRKIKK